MLAIFNNSNSYNLLTVLFVDVLTLHGKNAVVPSWNVEFTTKLLRKKSDFAPLYPGFDTELSVSSRFFSPKYSKIVGLSHELSKDCADCHIIINSHNDVRFVVNSLKLHHDYNTKITYSHRFVPKLLGVIVLLQNVTYWAI